MKLLEDYVPAMHRFGMVHDTLVHNLVVGAGIPDPIANIPTMPPAYIAAIVGAVVNTVVDIARS